MNTLASAFQTPIPVTAQSNKPSLVRVVPDPDVGARWGKTSTFKFNAVEDTRDENNPDELGADLKNPDDPLHRQLFLTVHVSSFKYTQKHTARYNGKQLISIAFFRANNTDDMYFETFRRLPSSADFGWTEVYPRQRLGQANETVRKYSYSFEFLPRPVDEQFYGPEWLGFNTALPDIWNNFPIMNAAPEGAPFTIFLPYGGIED